jgi:hypothetical protein
MRSPEPEPLVEFGVGHFAMTERSKRSPETSGVLHLVAFGLAAAATTTLFSVASVSLFGAGKEPHTSSQSDRHGFRYTDDEPAPFSPQTYSPSSASATLPLAAPAQAASSSEIPAAGDSRPGLELPSPDYDARLVLEARPELEGSAITKSQSAQVSGSQQPDIEGRPSGDELSAAAGSSRQPAPVENPDEPRDEISRNLLNQRDEPAKFDQNNAPYDAEAPPMGVQKQSLHLQLVDPNSASRARVQKECGPITFPALYRHCVASFRVRHR